MKKKTPGKSSSTSGNKDSAKGCDCQERVFDEFLEDVEKDMKRERYQELWAKYGRMISTITTLVLGGVLVLILWQRYDREQREDIASQLLQAQILKDQGKVDDALEVMRLLSQKSQKNYAVIAKLSQAAILIEQDFAKNVDEIQALYKNILEGSASTYYKALAAIQYVNVGLQRLGTGTPNEALKAEWLKLLRQYKGQQGFGLSASELEALVLFRAGDFKAARSILNELSKNPKTPPAMQMRVGILIQAIQNRR